MSATLKKLDPFGREVETCVRCMVPRTNLNGMTPWDYFHTCANLGKYGHATYWCACKWVDSTVDA